MKFIHFVCLLSIFSTFAHAKSEESLIFKLGEAILSLDGKSYSDLAIENERLVKEVDSLKNENVKLKTNSKGLKTKADQLKEELEREKIREAERLIWGENKPTLFKVFNKESHGIIRINPCGKESQVKSSKLFLVSKSGIGEMDYLKTVEFKTEVCEASDTTTLLEFEVNRGLLEEKMFVIDLGNLKYTAFDENYLESAKIKNNNPNGCETFIKGELEYIKCPNHEELKLNGKELIEKSADYSMPEIRVLGETVINGRKFLHIEYKTKSGVEILLKSEDGIEINSQSCDVLTMC